MEQSSVKWSHSKLANILSCPMSYYLTYKVGLQRKEEKRALSLGSAVHWGLEHSTEDLEQYFKDEGSWKQGQEFTDDQILAQAMVHGYLLKKDKIFQEILFDKFSGENAVLGEEMHEVFLDGKLQSLKVKGVYHLFVGIIDLLILTDKGWVIIDYKTSSKQPDWQGYLDQIYRYIFLIQNSEGYQDFPIYKIGIINLRKSMCRRKKGENEFSFFNRLKELYESEADPLIIYHEYLPQELDSQLVENYIHNLSKMVDTADMIDANQAWFINYGAANGVYGHSEFWDVFYHTPNAFVLYTIADKIVNKTNDGFVYRRDCVEIDMDVIDRTDIMNNYEKFKAQTLALYQVSNNVDKDELFSHLKKNFLCDDKLLEIYWNTLCYEINTEISEITPD